jgi:hypothetical protein
LSFNGFVFGIRAYRASSKADNKAIVGVGKVALFLGVSRRVCERSANRAHWSPPQVFFLLLAT